jgi:hypothetical protein
MAIREVQLLGSLRHPAILPLLGCTPLRFRRQASHPDAPHGGVRAAIRDRGAARNGRRPRSTSFCSGSPRGCPSCTKNRCIHRDLKPENILLDDACEPKIGDFGLSKYVDSGATLIQSMHGGTAQSMAPEIRRGEQFDFTADVYAFAITMSVVLTGLQPFPNSNGPYGLIRRVINGDRPTIPDYVNPGYAELMQRGWAQVFIERPTFDEIVYRLGEDDLLEGLDVDAVKDYQARVCPAELVPATSVSFHGKDAGSPVARLPIEELKKLSDSDDARSQVQFAEKLERGEEIQQNHPEAVKYYWLAANQGDADGLVALGRCLRQGIGVPYNPQEAVGLFCRAAKRNHPDGQYWLANCLRFEVGCSRDYAQAAQLYKLAADAGHGLAANQLWGCPVGMWPTRIKCVSALHLRFVTVQQRNSFSMAFVTSESKSKVQNKESPS